MDETKSRPRLEIVIYQLAGDALLKQNRTDGTGWDWCWADWRRDCMDATPNRFAYRCLPLTIANQVGWWVKNSVGFTATWRGGDEHAGVDFRFDAAADVWASWVDNQFGHGIVTWNTPFLFRTRPQGSRLLVCGPTNFFKANAQPLTALIESDWMSMSFTMNWKLTAPGVPVRFEEGEPLFQAIPLTGNLGADLEAASVSYMKLEEDPEVARLYREWDRSRRRFHQSKAEGVTGADGWQKDYFHGRDATGQRVAVEHMTRLRPPEVTFSPSTNPPRSPEHRPLARAEPPRSPQALGHLVRARDERSGAAAAERPTPSVLAYEIDDEWRRWVAENVLLDAPREAIVDGLIDNGLQPDLAEAEVDRAVQSPYTRGAERLRNRLRKRDWVLACYRKLYRMRPGSGEVVRRHRLSRAEFLEHHYAANRPVLVTGMMDDWPALGRWSLDYFAGRFGDREVEVQAGREGGADYEVSKQKYVRVLRFGDFVERVRGAGASNDLYLTAANNSRSKRALIGLWDDVAQVPEYLDGSDRTAGFLWLGPAGTVTPFHHDLTNNLMAQVLGRKRVLLVPSWDLPLMGNHHHVFSDVDGRGAAALPGPRPDQPQVLECVLGPGELLFLPVGWMHHVEALDVSATVSFTNFVFDNDFHSFYSTYDDV